MESFVKVEDPDLESVLAYLYFNAERYQVSEEPTWDGYWVIDSDFPDRQRLTSSSSDLSSSAA